jgi:hypothetical protein
MDVRATVSIDPIIQDICDRSFNGKIRRQEIIQHVIETTK